MIEWILLGIFAYILYRTLKTQCNPTSEQKLLFHSLGDVNDDGVIDQLDLDLIASALADPAKYMVELDIYGPEQKPDGVIDIFDLSWCSMHLGLTICSYFP